jgi:hypothetical protein
MPGMDVSVGTKTAVPAAVGVASVAGLAEHPARNRMRATVTNAMLAHRCFSVLEQSIIASVLRQKPGFYEKPGFCEITS